MIPYWPYVAEDCYDDSFRAVIVVRSEFECADLISNVVGFLFGCPDCHHDDHVGGPPWGACRRGSLQSGNKKAEAMPLLAPRSEEHTFELQARQYLVCRVL